MPFIDCKITKKLTDGQKEDIKSGLGRAISAMHKSESYLMVGIADSYTLYFAGKELASGAFVDVRAFGGVTPGDCRAMTAEICRILSECAGVQPQNIAPASTAPQTARLVRFISHILLLLRVTSNVSGPSRRCPGGRSHP